MNIINDIKKNIEKYTKTIYEKIKRLLKKIISNIKKLSIIINKSKEKILKRKKEKEFNKKDILTYIDIKKDKKSDKKNQVLTWEKFSKNNLFTLDYEEKNKEKKLIKAKKKKNKKINRNFLFIKIIFSIFLTIYATQTTKDIAGAIIGLTSLLIVIIITNVILNNNNKLGIVFNDIALLIYNAQYLVTIFGGTFISPIMLTNIDSLEQIGGRAITYIISILIVLIVTFLPIKKIDIEKNNTTSKIGEKVLYLKKFILSTKVLIILAIIDIFFVGVFPSNSEKLPYTAFLTTINDLYKQEKETNKLKELADSGDKTYSKKYFKKDLGGISDNEVELNIPDKPNIVLVFMEGVSSLIMESDKELMPNLYSIKQKSALSFDNYYNHTFATYRGIKGQLYSGFQKNNLDDNKLLSLQEILQKKEYNTEFINVEPKNATFSKYVDSLNFMNVTNPSISKSDEDKMIIKGVIPDKIAYEYLFDRIEENHKKNKKFFLSMYSVGTHATQKSFDKEYDDGSNNFYNKFYDLDYQIGEFIQKFNNSEAAKDTVVIFTTDHATALEQEYIDGIPEAKDELQQARIPLIFYYKDAQGQIKADASGRTSLDLAPTILDFLGFKNENSANYFLGTSLLIQDIDKEIEHICSYVAYMSITDNEEVRMCSLQEKNKYEKELLEYSKAALTGY